MIRLATEADEVRHAEERRLRQVGHCMSGNARYHLGSAEEMEAERAASIDALLEQRFAGRPHVPGSEWRAAYEEEMRARREREFLSYSYREPGQQVPLDRRSTHPLYRNEAVTFRTDWGPVTVGRGLARIYDMDGWPDAATLEAMAVQQAAQAGADYAAR